MNCEDFTFSSIVNMNEGYQLGTGCGNQATSNAFYVSDYFTGYDKIIANFNTSSTSSAYLCQYDDTSGTPVYNRITMRTGNTYDLDNTKYYKISTRVATGFANTSYLQKCRQLTPVQQVAQNLNSIDSDDLYDDMLTMTPFLIFLVIFSFSYLVLRKVVKSSSNGGVSI